MKHLNKYDSINNALEASGVYSPNVSYVNGSLNDGSIVFTNVGSDVRIEFVKSSGFVYGRAKTSSQPLTFTGKDTENTIQLKWNNIGYSAPSIDMEISVNDGDWRPYAITSDMGEIITLSSNDTVKFRGDNETLGNIPPGPGGRWQFVMTGIIEAHGNIMSLLDKTCERLTLSNDQEFCELFKDCISLTTAPSLPATTLSESCYSWMFGGCTALTEAPELPATSLANYCYMSMFDGCTALTEAPELPATELADYCYSNMFSSCTSLTTAPELPATTLVDNCYYDMFYGCSLLTSITVYVNNIFSISLGNWLYNTAQGTTGTLYSLGSADFTGRIPENWTIQNA